MLKNLKVYAIAPAKDLARAKAFYKEKLDLEPAAEFEGGAMYVCGGGTQLLVYETSFAGTAENTAMGWDTDDIEAEVAALKARGVVFEEYDMVGIKTVNSIADTGGEKAAWFKDSEGNILAISQNVKS
ncbi:MAG TPA: VOC family protein [Candidatus Saccharimonadales bacterium]|nr:VOC family protein [Candidatus Saccharimonadales bacterium]